MHVSYIHCANVCSKFTDLSSKILHISQIYRLVSLIIQEMEISANSLRNVLNRVLAERAYISIIIIINYGYMHSSKFINHLHLFPPSQTET